ncbi:MAG: hypothetical protein II820_09575 [Ruminiclostridium sp.]|nr:hypothetical protein [Ruminiclostridium sp.]
MKKYNAALLAALVLISASCSDISKPSVEAYTVREANGSGTGKPVVTTTVYSDDEGGLNIIAKPDGAGFETTGPENTEKPRTTTTRRTSKETTFPKQTTEPEEIFPVEDTSTAETTAVPETSQTTTTTTTTTAAVTTAAPETTAETTTFPVQTGASTTAAAAEKTYNVIGQNNILVSYQDGHYRGLMGCFGTYGLCDMWAEAVNTFAKKLPDVKVYSMAVPIPSEFYTPQSFWNSGFTVSQYNKVLRIREGLSGVTDVDAYSALAEHTDEYIYSRTDHHWTPLGAYYAAQKFAEAAGVDFPELDKYTPVSRSGYVGSMYTYSKDVHLYNDAETFTMYLSPNVDRISTTYYNTAFRGGYAGDLFVTRNASAFYCSFIGSDDRITHVKTDVGNGRTLVVFKQSYGNALIPFLTSGFEDIYVCDMRYFDLNGVQFCKDVGATDLLFADCVMIAAGNGGKYLNLLLNK